MHHCYFYTKTKQKYYSKLNTAQKFWQCANKYVPLHIILNIVQ